MWMIARAIVDLHGVSGVAQISVQAMANETTPPLPRKRGAGV
jgi:hypothetical protein